MRVAGAVRESRPHRRLAAHDFFVQIRTPEHRGEQQRKQNGEDELRVLQSKEELNGGHGHLQPYSGATRVPPARCGVRLLAGPRKSPSVVASGFSRTSTRTPRL